MSWVTTYICVCFVEVGTGQVPIECLHTVSLPCFRIICSIVSAHGKVRWPVHNLFSICWGILLPASYIFPAAAIIKGSLLFSCWIVYIWGMHSARGVGTSQGRWSQSHTLEVLKYLGQQAFIHSSKNWNITFNRTVYSSAAYSSHKCFPRLTSCPFPVGHSLLASFCIK